MDPSIHESYTQMLVRRLHRLCANDSFTDCKVASINGPNGGTSVLRAHRVVLAAASTYFQRELILQAAVREPTIDLSGFAADSVQSLVTFVYTGDLHMTAGGSRTDLLLLAIKCEMPHLQQLLKDNQPPQLGSVESPNENSDNSQLFVDTAGAVDVAPQPMAFQPDFDVRARLEANQKLIDAITTLNNKRQHSAIEGDEPYVEEVLSKRMTLSSTDEDAMRAPNLTPPALMSNESEMPVEQPTMPNNNIAELIQRVQRERAARQDMPPSLQSLPGNFAGMNLPGMGNRPYDLNAFIAQRMQQQQQIQQHQLQQQMTTPSPTFMPTYTHFTNPQMAQTSPQHDASNIHRAILAARDNLERQRAANQATAMKLPAVTPKTDAAGVLLDRTTVNDKDEGWCRNKKYIEKVDGGFMCTVCRKIYGRYNSVSYHVTIYHRNPPIECEHEGCNFTTREARYIHFHKYYRHGITLPKTIDLSSRSCPFCRHISKSPAMLDKHIRRHVGDRALGAKGTAIAETVLPPVAPKVLETAPHQCDVCNAQYESKAQLVEHTLRAHDRINLHDCEHCASKNMTPRAFAAHMFAAHPHVPSTSADDFKTSETAAMEIVRKHSAAATQPTIRL